MKVIGLTGGIGSGKSVVGSFFKELGAYYIDADELARRVVEPNTPAWKEIVETFSENVLNPDKTLNRDALAKIVFSNPSLLAKLNAITHPKIGKEILEELKKANELGYKIAIVDAALIFESNISHWFNKVIVVVADEEERVRRVVRRDGVREEEVRERMRNQLSDEERVKRADYVINNSGSIFELKREVGLLFRELLKD